MTWTHTHSSQKQTAKGDGEIGTTMAWLSGYSKRNKVTLIRGTSQNTDLNRIMSTVRLRA